MSQTDRITKTSMGDYDQVIALTQVMINEGLKKYWEKTNSERMQANQTPWKDNELKPVYQRGNGFSYEGGPNQFIKQVIFGPPAIILKPDGSDLSSIEYQLHLKSGYFQATRTWEKAPVEDKDNPWISGTTDYFAQYVIKDWKMTVPIKLKLRPLAKTSPEYEDAKKKKMPGNHTLYQLLVDTSSVGWLDIDISDMGKWQESDTLVSRYGKTSIPEKRVGEPRIFKEEPALLQKNFKSYAGECFLEAWSRNLDSLGTVGLSSERENKPTFTVVDVRHQTYPYREPKSQQVVPHGLGNGDLNYFLYLETIIPPAPLPDSAQAVLPGSGGNFTDGISFYEPESKKSEFGTYMLSRKVFLENHFLNILTAFNRIMHLYVIERRAATWPRLFGWNVTVKYTVHLGKGWPSTDNTSTYAWREGCPTINPCWEDQDSYERFRKAPADTLVWHNVHDEWDKETGFDHGGSVELWVYGSAVTIQRVLVTPESNVIKLEGMTISKFDYRIDPSWFERTWKGGFKCVATWEVTFTLKTYSDGGIGIDVSAQPPKVNISGIGGDDKWNLPQFRKDLEEKYKKVVDNFRIVTDALKNSLAGQERIILPSVGVYIFKNPLMNYKGDLVCEMEYNPNAEEETANPNANGPRDETVGAEPVPMVSIDGTVSHAVEKDGEPKIVETVTASHGDEM